MGYDCRFDIAKGVDGANVLCSLFERLRREERGGRKVMSVRLSCLSVVARFASHWVPSALGLKEVLNRLGLAGNAIA